MIYPTAPIYPQSPYIIGISVREVTLRVSQSYYIYTYI